MSNNIGTILEGLDGVQKAAVQCVDGPVLIVAGAGAGKTRVLTSRIAYSLEKGCDPGRIMALTFTKKAASEMKERIAVMVGEKRARRLVMGTFHSIFIRFLREYADLLGYPQNFTIYDTSDSTSAIKRCIKELKLDDKTYKPKTVLGRISEAKNNLWTAPAYRKNRDYITRDTQTKMPRMCDLYDAYQNMLKQNGVMDFDDILVNMNILLKHHPEALESIAGRFDYLLVDEYQDTNYSQYLILRNLSARHRNICVVGDDSQSIYAFRGARIQNILNFSKDYPDYKLFKLERNYRSTQTIVNAANSVIERNSGRIPKVCYSADAEGTPIKLLRAFTDGDEATMVVKSIVDKLMDTHAEYKDFAILYRTNSQSKLLEDALRRRNIPYRIFSGNSFFDRQEIKDMMAYLKLVVNPNDDESFRRIVNTPARGIGDTTIEALSVASKAAGVPLLQAIGLPELEKYGLRNAAVTKLVAFRDMIMAAVDSVTKKDAFEVAARLSDACGLYRSLKEDMSIESQSRASNVEELMNSIKDFVDKRHNDYIEELMAEEGFTDATLISEEDCPVVTLNEYLEDVALLSAVDTADGEEEDSDNKVGLMTVHSSKGLEFPHVYVVGMEDGLFPSEGVTVTSADIEEERRLFYVALTRAKKTVELSFCRTRRKNGEMKEYPVSRFVREIDEKYILNPLRQDEAGSVRSVSSSPNISSYGRGSAMTGRNRYGSSGKVVFEQKRPQSPQPSRVQPVSSPVRRPLSAPVADKDFEAVSPLLLKNGMRIEHNRFGFGIIEEISGNQSDLKAKINFDNYGQKILILKYAKIRLARD